MYKEWTRFKLFEHFPIASNVRPVRLAQNGFFYQGKGEEAKCAFCGIVNSTWTEGETVNIIHTRLSSACPFVSGQKTANVPIQSAESFNHQFTTPSPRTSNNKSGRRSNNGDFTALSKSDTANDSNAPSKQEQIHSDRNNSHQCDTTSRSKKLADERCCHTERTKYPQYSSRETRLESFTAWSYSHIVKPHDLCDAGLFYVGRCSKMILSKFCLYI